MFKFIIYKFGQFVVKRLPLKVAYKIAMFMSDVQYWLSPRDRNSVNDNLKVILGTSKDQPELTREVFRNFGKYLVEFFRMSDEIDESFLKDNVEIQDIENFTDLLKENNGAIVLTAHLGNWELGAMIFGFLGFPLKAIALPHKERPVNDLFNKQREKKGITVIPTTHAVRKCVTGLQNNEIVAVVADRVFGSKGIYLDMFGKKALIPKGPAIFSAKTGAAIVPSFLIRKEDDTFKMIFEKPIYPPAIDRSKEEVDNEVLVEIMEKYIDVIQNRIKEYPAQWLMFRKFWHEKDEND